MVVPIIDSITPGSGPTSGGDLVAIAGTGLRESVAVRFGDVAAEVLAARAGTSALLRAPPHAPGPVDVVIDNLDASGIPIPGESATLPSAYVFERPDISAESDLTRLVRTLLQELKRQIVESTNMTVSVDYGETAPDGSSVAVIAKLPSLVLSGPRIAENRTYSTNEPAEIVIAGLSGLELERRRPSLTVDLAFTLTGASDRTAELLNLMAAVATFLNRNRWIEMPRDRANEAAGAVRWEMHPDGDFRTKLDGPDDVRAFTCGLVVRGFDIDEGLPLDRTRAVEATELELQALQARGTS